MEGDGIEIEPREGGGWGTRNTSDGEVAGSYIGDVTEDYGDVDSIIRLPTLSRDEDDDDQPVVEGLDDGAPIEAGASGGPSTGRRKFIVAVAAASVLAVLVIGLGAGLGTQKARQASAANAVTLEMCLEMEDEWYAKTELAPSPTDMPTTYMPTTYAPTTYMPTRETGQLNTESSTTTESPTGAPVVVDTEDIDFTFVGDDDEDYSLMLDDRLEAYRAEDGDVRRLRRRDIIASVNGEGSSLTLKRAMQRMADQSGKTGGRVSSDLELFFASAYFAVCVSFSSCQICQAMAYLGLARDGTPAGYANFVCQLCLPAVLSTRLCSKHQSLSSCAAGRIC